MLGLSLAVTLDWILTTASSVRGDGGRDSQMSGMSKCVILVDIHPARSPDNPSLTNDSMQLF